MPFIDDLITANKSKKSMGQQTKDQEAQFNSQALTSLLKDPEAPHDAKGYAMHTLLTKHGGLSDEHSGNLLNLLQNITDATGGTGSVAGNDFPSNEAAMDPMKGPIDYSPTPTPQPAKHPMHDFLIETLAGALSGGKSEEALTKQREMQAQARIAETKARLDEQRQQRQSILQNKLSTSTEIAREGRAPANAAAMTPVEVDRATQIANAQAGFQSPTIQTFTDPNTGETFPAERNRQTGHWDRINIDGTPITNTPKKAPTLVEQGGQPVGIDFNGKVITDPNAMIPEARALFKAAQDAYQGRMTRDDAKTKEAEDRFNKSQEAINNRFAQTIAATQNRNDNAVYKVTSDAIDKTAQPISDSITRMSRLLDTLDQGTPLADSVVAPELMVVMAGGQGSGVRITQPEINNIMGSPSKLEQVKAALRQWSTNPAEAIKILEPMRNQIHALVTTVNDKLTAKQRIIDGARDRLATAKTEQEYKQIKADVQRDLIRVDTGANDKSGTIIDPSGVEHFVKDVDAAIKLHPGTTRKVAQ